jgi:hypothetical protein
METIKMAQIIKINSGKTLNFDLVAYNNLEKIICLGRYSNKPGISELQSFIDHVNQLKKEYPGTDIKTAIFISGTDYFSETISFYEKITTKQSLFDFGSPKCQLKNGGFNLLLVKETIDGFKLIRPDI